MKLSSQLSLTFQKFRIIVYGQEDEEEWGIPRTLSLLFLRSGQRSPLVRPKIFFTWNPQIQYPPPRPLPLQSIFIDEMILTFNPLFIS